MPVAQYPGPQPGMQMPQGHMMGGAVSGHPMHQGMMHQGVSGPGGPVSQAGPMMGMQPGAPNAHALSHLQPQQTQMFQQQPQQQPQHGLSELLLRQQYLAHTNNSTSEPGNASTSAATAPAGYD